MASKSQAIELEPVELKRQASTDSAKRKSPVSPQGYLDIIQRRAQRLQHQTLYAGVLFEDLLSWLKIPSLCEKYQPCYSEFATLFALDENLGSRDGKSALKSYQDAGKCVDDMQNRATSDPQVLFLKGYPPPDWIMSIGACCRVEPEFFRRTLRFLCRSEYCSSPSLPSAFSNIIKLRFTTISETNTSLRGQDVVDKLREKGAEGLETHKHRLKVGANTRKGDSIVRDYFVLDSKHSTIEQELSICMQPLGNSWVALVCSDVGRDLSLGSSGPWITPEDRKYSSSTTVYPTIQHKSRGFSKHSSNSRIYAGANDSDCFQSATLIPDEFGATLDKSLMRLDPFYALTELFGFSALSENQFLNLMEEKISIDAGYRSLKQKNPTLVNLLYFKQILEEHILRLKDTVRVIQDRGNSWFSLRGRNHMHPQATPSQNQKNKLDTAASDLLRDFEYLLDRAKDLKHRCDQGMTVMMNNATFMESRRALRLNHWAIRLTLVASFYIPFSFTTSFFGMNFRELGTGVLSVWAWFAVSIPVFLITLCVLLLDPSVFKRAVRGLRF